MIKHLKGSLLIITFVAISANDYASATNLIVDTGQTSCYNNVRQIPCPDSQKEFWGQDGNYTSYPPAYRDNGDNTVTDQVTGLNWSKRVSETKLSLTEANKSAHNMTFGGYTDWRVPNIKELYSLMNFSGDTGSPEMAGRNGYPSDAIPFIDTDYFDFRYGNTANGERYIDAQWLSSTRYVSTTMGRDPTLFGVNFADGRIKGYPDGINRGPRGEKKYYVRYVRGPAYGENQFVDNGDGTITDAATGLTWTQNDSGKPMTWQEALKFAEKYEYGGYSDWRLPNAKELQYLVDYTRSPDTTGSAAIHPVFRTTAIVNEAGQRDYPFYWTSTTHVEGRKNNGVYICFGRGIGSMHGQTMDVHGAGAQRSDPKVGSRAQLGGGPQGDAIRINNFVRLVRGGTVTVNTGTPIVDTKRYPNKVRILENSMLSNRTNTRSQGMEESQRGHPNQLNGGSMSGPPMREERGGDHFVTRLDRNGDGKVSKSEFDGPAEHFSTFDKNNDGYITATEAPTGPPPRKQNTY